MSDIIINIVFVLAFLAVVAAIVKISVDEKKARNQRLEAASALIKARHEAKDIHAAELRKRHEAIARQAAAREATDNARASDPSALSAAVAKARAENPQRMQRPARTQNRPVHTNSSPTRDLTRRNTDSGTPEYGRWDNGVWLPATFAMGGYLDPNSSTAHETPHTPAPEPEPERETATPTYAEPEYSKTEYSTPDYSSNDSSSSSSSSSSDSSWSSDSSSGGGDY